MVFPKSPKIDALSELTFFCLKKSPGLDCLGRGAASPLVDTCGKIKRGNESFYFINLVL